MNERLNAREELVAIVIRVPRSLRDALKARAANEERSMAQAIRHALREYLRG